MNVMLNGVNKIVSASSALQIFFCYLFNTSSHKFVNLIG